MIYHGDCLEVLRTLPDCSVDAVVTDPPYGLSFMGKKWDYDVPSEEVWRECLRVLKPGGHLLAFAGTRTQHRMAVRIEDAGFEIRDMIAWVYGSGFPKSLDVSKAIDKAAGYERATEYEPNHKNGTFGKGMGGGKHGAQSEPPITDAARQWQGWGTALKPALEPITVARKPLVGTVAENVLAHGTGAINVDGCRVGDGSDRTAGGTSGDTASSVLADGFHGTRMERPTGGRWPANLIHDGSDEVVCLFPVTTSGTLEPHHNRSEQRGVYGKYNGKKWEQSFGGDTGSAARFFYAAKASKRDRDEGLEGFAEKATAFGNQAIAEMKRGNLEHADGKSGMNKVKMRQNTHPTVKPTDLMRYLCRLVTPPGGTVLDPFMGSGSTGKAAILEGFRFIGIEREAEYVEIAKARIAAVQAKPKQEDLF